MAEDCDFCCDLFADSDFIEKTGISLETFTKKANFVEFDSEAKVAHFFPSKTMGKNYAKFVEKQGLSKENRAEMVETVRKYTFHDSFYCTVLNLLLAADTEELKTEALFIHRLKTALFSLSALSPPTAKRLFRGMHLSELEFQAHPLNELIYIPSFLSTSRNPDKFYKSANNCLVVIKLEYIPNNALEITEELSVYAKEEEEVLFSCYSRFRVLEKRKDFCYKGTDFKYFIVLEHVNQPREKVDLGAVLMVNFLGF